MTRSGGPTRPDATRRGVGRLLAAIESRDLRRIAASLHPDATWQDVPHPLTIGRDAVVAMLAGIVRWSDEVRWDVVSATTTTDIGWYERVDRFWIDGDEHAVSCNGVFTVDATTGLVREVRDYVDLTEWRQRIEPVYEAMAGRPTETIVTRHLAAVARREPVAMAADYALDATVERGGTHHVGWAAIADYFDDVPGRLGPNRLAFGDVVAVGGPSAMVNWAITGDDGRVVASGRDHYETQNGRIIRQIVELDGTDF